MCFEGFQKFLGRLGEDCGRFLEALSRMFWRGFGRKGTNETQQFKITNGTNNHHQFENNHQPFEKEMHRVRAIAKSNFFRGRSKPNQGRRVGKTNETRNQKRKKIDQHGCQFNQ